MICKLARSKEVLAPSRVPGIPCGEGARPLPPFSKFPWPPHAPPVFSETMSTDAAEVQVAADAEPAAKTERPANITVE